METSEDAKLRPPDNKAARDNHPPSLRSVGCLQVSSETLDGLARMTSQAELCVSRDLRAILDPLATGASIGNSTRFLEVQSALERMLPAELGWEYESFDAFRFAVARKIGPDEAEFVGLALFILDQTWTPIHLRLQVSSQSDEIAAIDCKVGEPGDGPLDLVRIPYGSSRADKYLHRLVDRVASVKWVYRATRTVSRPTK